MNPICFPAAFSVAPADGISVHRFKTDAMKKILVTGVNSYIGNSFREYMQQFSDEYVVDGIVSGETYSMLITGTITNVGTQQNTYTIIWDKSAKEANYDLQSQTLGTLEVTHRATVITAKNCSKTYGDNDPTFDFTATNLVSGETEDLFEINYTRDDVEDVGEYNIVPNGGSKGDKQGNYKLTFSNAGKLTITKRELKIKTFSSSRQYNGMDLTADGTSSN